MYAACDRAANTHPKLACTTAPGPTPYAPEWRTVVAMTTTSRCDRIIALIDECLNEHNPTPRAIVDDLPLTSPRQPVLTGSCT